MNLNAPHDAIRLPKGSDYLHQIFFYLPFGCCIARAVVRERVRHIAAMWYLGTAVPCFCPSLLAYSSVSTALGTVPYCLFEPW